MIKKITIHEPKILGYLHHAYPLSVMPDHKDFESWFYSNYIQIFCYREFDGDACPINFYRYHDWSYYPLLDHQKIARQIVTRGMTMIEFIINSINMNYCVYTYVNEYHIPNRTPFQVYDSDHDILIIGYETEKEILHAVSFINGRLSEFEISFAVFNLAFDSVKMSFEYVSNIRLFKCNHNE